MSYGSAEKRVKRGLMTIATIKAHQKTVNDILLRAIKEEPAAVEAALTLGKYCLEDPILSDAADYMQRAIIVSDILISDAISREFDWPSPVQQFVFDAVAIITAPDLRKARYYKQLAIDAVDGNYAAYRARQRALERQQIEEEDKLTEECIGTSDPDSVAARRCRNRPRLFR